MKHGFRNKRVLFTTGIATVGVLVAVSITLFVILSDMFTKHEDLMGEVILSPVSQPGGFKNLLTQATPTPSPTPTPKPYPPKGWTCVTVPILMYHHVQPMAEAKQLGHAGLTVDSGTFAAQLDYLKGKGYTTMYLSELADHFDTKKPLPSKPIILTFDDAYDDFSTYAVPALSSRGMKAELFVPTGLIQNIGYMSWDQVKDASSKGIAISHHTWSHANMGSKKDQAFFTQEIDIATTQLAEHGFGSVTTFAYPYGAQSGAARSYLSQKGFRIAVTTLPGSIQCKEDRLSLHRTGVGGVSLSKYGL